MWLVFNPQIPLMCKSINLLGYLKKGNVNERCVVVDELKKKHFKCVAILVVGERSWHFHVR